MEWQPLLRIPRLWLLIKVITLSAGPSLGLVFLVHKTQLAASSVTVIR